MRALLCLAARQGPLAANRLSDMPRPPVSPLVSGLKRPHVRSHVGLAPPSSLPWATWLGEGLFPDVSGSIWSQGLGSWTTGPLWILQIISPASLPRCAIWGKAHVAVPLSSGYGGGGGSWSLGRPHTASWFAGTDASAAKKQDHCV